MKFCIPICPELSDYLDLSPAYILRYGYYNGDWKMVLN